MVLSADSATSASAAGNGAGEPIAESVRQSVHVVRTGDTLFAIALQYGTTIEKIMEDNQQLTDPNSIRPFQKLIISK